MSNQSHQKPVALALGTAFAASLAGAQQYGQDGAAGAQQQSQDPAYERQRGQQPDPAYDAQQQQRDQQMMQGAQAQVSDEELEQFLEAHQKVIAVQEEYIDRIQNTQDVQDNQNLQREAEGKMAEAVQETGLEVSEYNDIARQLQQDPQLRDRLQEMVGVR